MHAHAARGIRCAHGSICARPRHREPRNAKPASEGGSAYPAKPGKSRCLARRASPKSPVFASPVACTGKVRPEPAASGRVAAAPRRLPLFQIAAVPFDDFDTLDVPDGPRWLLVRLARYADREGRCFPSMRTLAAGAQEVAGDDLPLAEAALRSGVFHADPGSRPRLPLHARRTLPAALAGAAQVGGRAGCFTRARGCFTARKTGSRSN